MTRQWTGPEIAAALKDAFPEALTGVEKASVTVRGEDILNICRHMHDAPALAFDYLVSLNAVDYIDSFEVVYQMVSIQHNHMAVLRARAYGREAPALPSVCAVWRGANLQEREVYDLMGVQFDGHPNMRRIFLWDGFEDHPLRKDFLLQRP